MDGKIKTCTKGGITGDLNTHSIEDILHNKEYTNLKRNILKDEKTTNCKNCIKLENIDESQEHYSFLRNNYNSLFKNNEVDYFDCDEFVLGGLDLHWSSVCDLKCVTCWAGQSSSIAKEQGKPVVHTPKHIADKFIEYVEKHQNTLKEVYLSGGEPTLINHNLRLLQKLEKRSDLQIRVNSNLMWNTNNQILQEILKFPNVLFTCSADGLQEKFEYIRRGASWKTFVDNLNFLKDKSNVEIRVNSVFFILQSYNLLDTIQYFDNNFGISNFTINQCGMGHTYLRCRNLSDYAKDKTKKTLLRAKEIYQNNANLVGQLNNCLKELQNPGTEEYKHYLDNIDKIQKSNWRKTFKDLT